MIGILLIAMIFLMLFCIAAMVPLIILLAMRKIAKKALAIVGIVILGIIAMAIFGYICSSFLVFLL